MELESPVIEDGEAMDIDTASSSPVEGIPPLKTEEGIVYTSTGKAIAWGTSWLPILYSDQTKDYILDQRSIQPTSPFEQVNLYVRMGKQIPPNAQDIA